MKYWNAALLLPCILIPMTGCVQRTYSINSEPPGAKAYVAGELLGTTPLEKKFTFYGTREVILRKDGYKASRNDLKLKTPFYQIFPLDIVAESIPTKIEDKHSFSFSLEKAEVESDPDLLARANTARKLLDDVPVVEVSGARARKSKKGHGTFPYKARERSWWRIP